MEPPAKNILTYFHLRLVKLCDATINSPISIEYNIKSCFQLSCLPTKEKYPPIY